MKLKPLILLAIAVFIGNRIYRRLPVSGGPVADRENENSMQPNPSANDAGWTAANGAS